MRRFSEDLWTGIVCGYFFVFAFDGVTGLMQLIGIIVAKDPNPVLTPVSVGFTVAELMLHAFQAFVAVQLMMRVSYANICGAVAIFLHLAAATYLLQTEWKQTGMIGSCLPVLYTVAQMILAVMVLFVLRYLRINESSFSRRDVNRPL